MVSSQLGVIGSLAMASALFVEQGSESRAVEQDDHECGQHKGRFVDGAGDGQKGEHDQPAQRPRQMRLGNEAFGHPQIDLHGPEVSPLVVSDESADRYFTIAHWCEHDRGGPDEWVVPQRATSEFEFISCHTQRIKRINSEHQRLP
jgi:hypothetical protein